jgi:hypothetical protein
MTLVALTTNTLEDSEGWLTRWDDLCVIYALEWGGKGYIGSSTNIKSRMSWWRSNLRFDGVNLGEVRAGVICSTPECAREVTERVFIETYDTFASGHNQTHTGKAGARMDHFIALSTADKIRETKRANPWTPTDEQRARMSRSATLRGKPK